jgi:hypothetical protein
MPNTPGMIVYSLGGLRDDSDMFRRYFGSGDFPEWDQIHALPSTRSALARRATLLDRLGAPVRSVSVLLAGGGRAASA